MQETYTHFPYTGSEQVEKNDKSLKWAKKRSFNSI
jgi:hypothetical protein